MGGLHILSDFLSHSMHSILHRSWHLAEHLKLSRMRSSLSEAAGLGLQRGVWSDILELFIQSWVADCIELHLCIDVHLTKAPEAPGEIMLSQKMQPKVMCLQSQYAIPINPCLQVHVLSGESTGQSCLMSF